MRRLAPQDLRIEAEEARLLILRMLRGGRSGHVGGALSCVDILTTLYFDEMDIDPLEPTRPDRDRFILSAGHKALAQYAVLARRGYFPEPWVDTYSDLGSRLAGHPDMHKLPGVEANTGALGHGLSIACGIALGLRLQERRSRVFVVLGDGELPEGSNWEGAAMAAHHQLGNVVAFVDVNDLQISGRTADVMNMEPIADKFAAFGWKVRTIDGNDVEQIQGVLAEVDRDSSSPTAVVAKTTKAKGVSILEDTAASHYWKPAAAEMAEAEAEIRARIQLLSLQAVAR
ncbi:transketolase [Aeromicrobium sp. Root472D3]|uniref:transketolase n=1 Tax=Aeromicrobium sp. Root472D3 TaxID=1736540 RepID=UPI0006F67DA2|nr:transketolase [Aeromicrobium sp. Root472D3]KQX74519.1 transketolase [Aeromicrobium sp. Root472D3]